jgi:hypothetical protein
MDKKDKIKKKIAKLLALAASTNSVFERDNATAKAMAYMTGYRLSMSDIEAPTMVKQEFKHTGVKISKGDADMVTVIAAVLGVHVTYLHGWYGSKGTFFFIGESSDIDFAWYVFQVAGAQIKKKAKEYRISLGGAGTGYMNSYRHGLKIGFTDSFVKSNKVDSVTKSSDNDDRAIMALDNRYALACEFAGDNFAPEKRKIKINNALVKGFEDSKCIIVNKGVNGEYSETKLLGSFD